MAATNRCMRCMIGTFSGGTCTHCHRPEPSPEQVDTTALPVGYVLHGQYYMGEPLGHGGFGITYAAWDVKNKTRVAVKEFFPAKMASRNPDRHTVDIAPGAEANYAQIFRSFENEARLLMSLQNLEGIIHLYHAFEENNTAYYVMEYLEGLDLNQYLKKNGTMTWEAIAPILRTLLRALSSLHKEGLIHRDISPDNIYLLPDGSARLIDFGSVRAQQSDHFTAYVKQSFAPWEQYRSEGKQGTWTDVYALCVTIYYVLSGKLPPVAPQRMVDDQVIPLSQLRPQVPAHVSPALAYGMAVTSDKRCQTIAELADLLFPGENLITDAAPRSDKPPAPTPAAPVQPVRPVPMRQMVCYRGHHTGKQWPLNPGTAIRIGRSRDLEIQYPFTVRGVSRLQCTLFTDMTGRTLVRDERSSYGTYLVTEKAQVKLVPGQWYLANGCWLCFGQQEQYLIQ